MKKFSEYMEADQASAAQQAVVELQALKKMAEGIAAKYAQVLVRSPAVFLKEIDTQIMWLQQSIANKNVGNGGTGWQ